MVDLSLLLGDFGSTSWQWWQADTFPAGRVVGLGQSKIKDHPSSAEARVGAELGNNGLREKVMP